MGYSRENVALTQNIRQKIATTDKKRKDKKLYICFFLLFCFVKKNLNVRQKTATTLYCNVFLTLKMTTQKQHKLLRKLYKLWDRSTQRTEVVHIIIIIAVDIICQNPVCYLCVHVYC